MWKLKIHICLGLIFCSVQNSNGTPRIDPLVESGVGLIRGLRATDGDYSMFLGIPYATVDVENPFGPSSPHPIFDDVFEAYDDSAICPQAEQFTNTILGTLDCLHLNIYVPNSASSRNRMPVLVWVHGGGFSNGFSGRYLYGPKYLVRNDIILVTLNYRVGPYGFMCLDTPNVPGNQGLKDQSLALKWIKNNIEAFGGDSNKITIYGESAGGVSVDYQLTYGDRNLFDKIIMHSGNALSPWAVSEPNNLAPLKLAEQLGHLTSNIDDALLFLTTVDTNLVIASATILDLSFSPCVEKEFDDIVRFIDDYPLNIKNIDIRSKSILLAHNRDENLLQFTNQSPEDYKNMNLFDSSLRSAFNFTSEELEEMEAIVRHFYIGDEAVSEAVNQELSNFQSDLRFIYPTVRNIQRYLDNGAKNIFYFIFSYDGERNFIQHKLNVSVGGAVHADEMGYLFDVSYMGEPSTEDQLAIDRITAMWSNFVKIGNPIPETTEQLPVQWPPVTEDKLHYLELDTNLNVGQRYFKERMTFWDLFYKLNEEAQIGYKK